MTGVTTSVAKPLRALVIGAGPAAVGMHLPVLAARRDRGEIALSQICDIRRERAAAARHDFGFEQESGDAIGALARQDIDIVYAFGSAQLHYEYGLVALRGGKHLFVEKPVAPSYVQARELAQTARAHGLVAVGGHNRRFYKSLALVRARAGKAGWRFAEAVFHKPEYGRPPLFGARTWLGANGIHGLDALLFMMGGLPEHLMALTGEAGAAEPAAFSAMMRWRDGAQGVFLCNNNAGSRREEYVFHGLGETCTVTGGGVKVDRDHATLTTPVDSIGDGIAAEHDSFLQAIRQGMEPPHALDVIAPSLFLAELIEGGFSGRVQLPMSQATPIQRTRGPGGNAVLVDRPAGLQAAISRWLPGHQLVSPEDVRDSPGQRPDIVAAILGRGSSALPTEVLDKLPGLTVVGIAGLSFSPYAPGQLLSRGIALVNASAAHAQSVAEFALGLAILGRRRAFISHAVMSNGGWGTQLQLPGLKGLLYRTARAWRPGLKVLGLEPILADLWRRARPVVGITGSAAPGARDLQGATVGLVGWGENARAFAERLARAGSQVIVYSEHATEADFAGAQVTRVSLGEALAADVVSVHRGLNPGTVHFMGSAELAHLRPGAVLINVARGALIEPGALLARLKRGDIFACLDTFEREPPAASDPLRRLPNVFLTSHIAGGSPDMQAVAADEVVRKVAAHLAGQATDAISAQRLQTMT